MTNPVILNFSMVSPMPPMPTQINTSLQLGMFSCEAYWLRNFYKELEITQKSPTMIKGDNNGSISMVRNPQFHNCAKHIAICYHRVWDMINEASSKLILAVILNKQPMYLQRLYIASNIKNTSLKWGWSRRWKELEYVVAFPYPSREVF